MRRWSIGLPLGLAAVVAVATILVTGPGSLTVVPGLVGWQTAMRRALATVPQHGLTLGDHAAPVTVTEYADLRCGYCQAYGLTVFPFIVGSYVQTGRVKLVFRPVAMLGLQSERAAAAATAAAAQNRLWDFLDAFYYHQQAVSSNDVTDGSLHQVAHAAGLDVGRLTRQRTSPAVLTLIHAQTNQARSAGVTRIPTFVISAAGVAGASQVTGYGPLLDALRRVIAAHG